MVVNLVIAQSIFIRRVAIEGMVALVVALLQTEQMEMVEAVGQEEWGLEMDAPMEKTVIVVLLTRINPITPLQDCGDILVPTVQRETFSFLYGTKNLPFFLNENVRW
jgi:hypothetical protein